ncbi:MAG: glycosyltransferase, partial [Chloroflexota bacterium]
MATFRIAMLSVHGCPLAPPGTRDAGGMQMYVKALSRELARRGMVVDVFTRRTDPGLPAVVPFGAGARVIHVDAGEPMPMDKNAVADALPEFVCNVKRIQRDEGIVYDVIHSHYWLSGWVGSLLARRWAIPHVTMFHTLGRLKNRALADQEETEARIRVEEHVVASADRIIASSEHERQALVEQYRARRERVAVINGGVDLRLFRPSDRMAARASLGLDRHAEIVLFVGRMDRVKGLDVLLRAGALLKQRPRLKLVIVGGSAGDAELTRCSALAHQLGLDASFRGATLQEDLPLYYNAADLLVVPSHYESFGLVAVEALACGRPVIASTVGGLPTVVHDEENGLLVPWRQPEAFAERIARVLDDAALRTRLSDNARPSALRYSWEAVAERVAALYREAAPA